MDLVLLYTHRAWPKVWLTIYTISQQQQHHGDTQCRKCDPAGDSHSFFSLRQCTSLSNSCISFSFLFFGCYAIYRIISKEISSPVKEHVRYRVNIIVSYYYYIEKRGGGEPLRDFCHVPSHTQVEARALLIDLISPFFSFFLSFWYSALIQLLLFGYKV